MELSNNKFRQNYLTDKMGENLFPRGYKELKELNCKISALKVLTEEESLQSMPDWVGFSTTTFCNLRCPHCSTHGTENIRRIYNKQRWSLETIRRIGKECLPSASHFSLALNGEPLTTPRLTQILSEFKRYGAKLQLNTNGTLVSQRTLTNILPISGSICVSLDGASKYTVERIRLGANFEQLLYNIRLAARTCQLLPKEILPDVQITFVVMASNMHEMPLMPYLASILGIKTLVLNLIVVFYPHLRDESVERHKTLYNNSLKQTLIEAERYKIKVLNLHKPFLIDGTEKEQPQLGDNLIIKNFSKNYSNTLPDYSAILNNREIEFKAVRIAEESKRIYFNNQISIEDIDIKKVNEMKVSLRNGLSRNRKIITGLRTNSDKKLKFCENLFNRVFINNEGEVAPCCIPSRPVLGNIYDNNMKEIWNGNIYQEFRRQFRSESPPNCCKGCYNIVYKPAKEFIAMINRDFD